MNLLRVKAVVYDCTTMEYVQRIAEVPVSDEAIKALQDAMWNNGGPCPIKGYGHGDGKDKKRYLPFSTPLRDQRRYHIDPVLELVEVDDETKEEKSVGGWRGL